jgi:membrane-bound lytic murein transglycosylase B
MGGHDIVQGLATLAWEGRRRSWAEGELISVARMIDAGYARREDLRGSWAGAMGQTQFIPSTYLRAAVDWDGDGRRDIWQVEADALASAANLLAVEGWVEGAPIAVEVGLPEDFDLDAWEPRQRRRGHEWAELNITPLSGEWATDNLMRRARLILPAGASGPGFLAFENFEAVRRYNNSTAYVLAVAHLAERIAGRAAWVGEWPETARPLTRAQTRELQAGLNALGFDSGTPDGIAGPNTRRALRAFQRASGLPADGFVSLGMYEAVREARG